MFRVYDTVTGSTGRLVIKSPKSAVNPSESVFAWRTDRYMEWFILSDTQPFNKSDTHTYICNHAPAIACYPFFVGYA